MSVIVELWKQPYLITFFNVSPNKRQAMFRIVFHFF